MNTKLKMLRLATSDKVRKQQISFLLTCAEQSFGVKAPPIRELSYQEALGLFAKFTQEQAELCIERGNLESVRQKLYANAFELANKVKRRLGIRKPEEALFALTTLYENIGISVEGSLLGELCFHRCYFSEIYTPETCTLMSAFDSGVCGGLMGDGHLVFSDRITQGQSCCKARYVEGPLCV